MEAMVDCIISAGGIPREGDPLFEQTRGKPKALLEIGGKPMVQWVLDALASVQRIERIIMVGLSAKDGISSAKLVSFVPNHGSLLNNVIAGVDRLLEINPTVQQVVMSSADIPLLTSAIVDEFLDLCADFSLDAYYGVVERTLMESRFPDSRRSYIHLTDGDFAGADIFVINPQIVYTNRQFWENLAAGRKSVFKLARTIGLGTLLELLLRRLSLAEMEERVMKAIKLTGRAVKVRHAELGMDVDKPFQLEICRRELAGR
jgi:GTP:adenosylcobinamide-phosphate guanylyltransferase